MSVSATRTIVVDRQYQCSYLSAYATSTGTLLWRHKYVGTPLGTANIVGGLVYVEDEAPSDADMLDAYDVTTGALKWRVYDGDDYGQLMNSIGSGLVVNSTWADDAFTGSHRFTVKMVNAATTDGSGFVAGGRMYYNSDRSIAAYSVTSGALLWSYTKPGDFYGPGSGNAVPALHGGLLYVHSIYGLTRSTTVVLNPATGALVRTLPVSYYSLAFDGKVGFFTTQPINGPSTISAVNLGTGHVYWHHTLAQVTVAPGATEPTVLYAAPIVENGLVWILDGVDSGTPGHVVALDEVTGATRSITVERCPPGVGMLAVAQHRIFASSLCGVLTYTGT